MGNWVKVETGGGVANRFVAKTVHLVTRLCLHPHLHAPFATSRPEQDRGPDCVLVRASPHRAHRVDQVCWCVGVLLVLLLLVRRRHLARFLISWVLVCVQPPLLGLLPSLTSTVHRVRYTWRDLCLRFVGNAWRTGGDIGSKFQSVFNEVQVGNAWASDSHIIASLPLFFKWRKTWI